MSKPATPHRQALAELQALGYNRAPRAVTSVRGRTRHVTQVLGQSPGLAELSARAADGKARLQAIAPLLPPGLRQCVQSGTVEDTTWNLLVPHAAAAAKLRQMLPALAAHLRSQGWPITQMQVKVQSVR